MKGNVNTGNERMNICKENMEPDLKLPLSWPTSLAEIDTVILIPKCQPLEQSDFRRLLCRIEEFTLAWSHAIGQICGVIYTI